MERKDKIFTYVMAFLVALACFLTFTAVDRSFAEDAYAPNPEDAAVTEPHIIYTHYTSEWLYALVDLPEDGAEYFMRITFFIPGNMFFVLVLPIADDGTFFFWISCPAEYVAMQVADRQDALIPGTYTPYHAIVFRGLCYE